MQAESVQQTTRFESIAFLDIDHSQSNMEPESSTLSDIKDVTSIEVEKSETSSSCESKPLRHSLYYSGEHIVLKIDETLYHVEKSVLCQFDTFRDMFEGASLHNWNSGEGTSDDNPITLQGVTKFEMDGLLSVLSARWYKGKPKIDIEQWKAILHLSTMWEFGTLRDFAIGKIQDLKIPAMDSLLLATKCRVQQWLKPAYVELCRRSALLSDQEAELLGLPIFAALSRLRETSRILSEVKFSQCYHTQKCKECKACTISWCNGSTQASPGTKGDAVINEGVDKLIASGLTPPYNQASHAGNTESASKEPRTESGTANQTTGYTDYLDDCTNPVILRVENTLYRLPKGIISQFAALRSRLEEAFEENSTCGGISDENPIVLKDATTMEFESVLLVLSARWFKQSFVVTLKQWKAILSLSTLWEFPALRSLSITYIESFRLAAMDLIILSRQCQVSQWLAPAYAALCTQDQPLTMQEGHVLGFELFAQLTEIRERRLRASYYRYNVNEAVRKVISGS
ncbi:hypothetical protein FRC03_003374 [Tulasnella sp. 419]|nr:hypothetical protein FRC03_003374 [Tulasnella sp. 419]